MAIFFFFIVRRKEIFSTYLIPLVQVFEDIYVGKGERDIRNQPTGGDHQRLLITDRALLP